MIKVFLVEDEVIIRQSIKKNVEWEREGFEFVGEARDGELAYPMIQKVKPDIIITDIRMPFLDGLELSKLVKNEMPWIKIIILSGYDEFEYARKAISLGITEYLLKPISGVQLLQAILKVKAIIEEERIKEDHIRRFRLEMKMNEQLKKQNFFLDLVSDKLSTPEIYQRAKELNLDLYAQYYNIIIIQLENADKEERNNSKEIYKVKEDIIERYENSIHIVFDRMDDTIALLIKCEDDKHTEEAINIVIEDILKQIGSKSHLDYFIAVGNEVERISELSMCYLNVCKAFTYRYILGKNQIIHSEDLIELHEVQMAGLNAIDLNIGRVDLDSIEKFIKNGKRNEISTYLHEYFENFGKKNMKSLLFRQYIVMNIYFKLMNVLEEWGTNPKSILEICEDNGGLAKVIASIHDTNKYLERMLYQVIEYRDILSRNKNITFLENAKKYIEENYANEEISLNVVAKFINISPSYFSSIFSQEYGKTFIEYLTEVRMNKAKELLRCTNMKSSEIAYTVGYKDPHYFSYLFKKTQNSNPKEYRMQGKGE